MKTNFTIVNFRTAIILGCLYTFAGNTMGQEGTVEAISYYSTTQNDTCQMNVYCPPGYYEEGDTNHYPVLYLVHGYGEDYTYWDNYGHADTVLNYYITHDIAVPMIVVMPDGRNLPAAVYSSEILNDIMPYTESHFRVKTDKDSRGIGGLSWGGSQSLKTGILNYELFGYLTIMSSGYFSDTDFNEAEAFLDTMGADVEKSLRYFYFAQGSEYDITYEGGMQALAMFREKGLTVHYWEYSGGHQWSVWRQDFKSFAPYLFRDSTVRYISLVFQGGVIKNSTIMTYKDSLATEPAAPTRTGYSFAGWYRQPECIDSFNFALDTVRSNMTLYANWSPNPYKVSFNSHGGNYTPDTIVALYGTRIEEPAEPEKEGYIFGGWYTDDTYAREWIFETNAVREDITLHAYWIDPNALNENLETVILVFPNPAGSFVNLRNIPFGASIKLYSPEGRLVMDLPGDNSDTRMDISDLPRGIYYLLIRTEMEDFRYKLVKE